MQTVRSWFLDEPRAAHWGLFLPIILISTCRLTRVPRYPCSFAGCSPDLFLFADRIRDFSAGSRGARRNKGSLPWPPLGRIFLKAAEHRAEEVLNFSAPRRARSDRTTATKRKARRRRRCAAPDRCQGNAEKEGAAPVRFLQHRRFPEKVLIRSKRYLATDGPLLLIRRLRLCDDDGSCRLPGRSNL